MAISFEQALAGPGPVITAEITPPLGADPSRALAAAEALRGLVQAFNVTDGSRAVMRMASIALCKLLQDRDLEPVLQVGCRDRNRIALQADLLGAQALGLRNVLCLTGDPVRAGNQSKARPVFDFESCGFCSRYRPLIWGLIRLESCCQMAAPVFLLVGPRILNPAAGVVLKAGYAEKLPLVLVSCKPKW